MYINIFEYLGSAMVVVSGTVRALSPKDMWWSFTFSIIGSAVLLIYSVNTGQIGFVLLNTYCLIMSGIGLYKWQKIEIVDKI